ncbi:MAG: glycosyl hydrolase [Chloroflexota bacterium]
MKASLGRLVASLALAAGILSGAAQPAAAVAPTASFGASDAFRVDQTNLAYGLGIKFERLTFWWSGLQPDGPGQALNPFYLPVSYIDQERAHGIQVIGVIDSTPAWAQADPSQGVRSVPKNLNLAWNDPNNYWGQFVQSIVKMYAGHIDQWVIWNEPDITPSDPNAAYYVFAGTPQDYAQLLKVGYLAAHAANPNVKVMAAGVTYWTDIHSGRPQYFQRLLDTLAQDPSAPANNWYFDIATLHLYTNPEGLFKVPNLFHQMMLAKGFDKPIWVNETNVVPYNDPVNAGTPNGTATQQRSTLDEQASYMTEAMAMGRAAGVDHIEVYRMKDGDGDVINGEALVRADLSKRPEYDAFQTGIKYFSTGTPTLFAPGDLREVVFDQGSQRVTVVWDASPTPISIHVPAAGTGATLLDKLGTPQPLSASGGVYGINLPGATMHTDQDNPKAYLIGGSPWIIVETGVSGPVQGATNLSPLTYQPFKMVASPAAGQPDSGDVPATGFTYGASAPAAAPAAAPVAAGGACSFELGFKAFHDQLANVVGNCVDNEGHNPANGDALQLTTGVNGKGGMLVWRKADNWTAYTDGFRTWINGPNGIQKRLNTDPPFPWEGH